VSEAAPAVEAEAAPPAKKSRAGRRKKTAEPEAEAPAPEPANDRNGPASPEGPALERQADSAGTESDPDDAPGGPPRRGWWQRTFGA
jgi:ribonuclease E